MYPKNPALQKTVNENLRKYPLDKPILFKNLNLEETAAIFLGLDEATSELKFRGPDSVERRIHTSEIHSTDVGRSADTAWLHAQPRFDRGEDVRQYKEDGYFVDISPR